MGIQKGGKAKPLSLKVSIDNVLERCAETASIEYFGALAHASLGIDCAALFSGPVEAAAEAARGSVSLDSMHLCFGS